MWPALAVLELLRENAQRQNFGFRHCLVSGRTIRQNARQLRNLSKPTAIFFAFTFDFKFHRTPHAGSIILSLSGFDAQRTTCQAFLARLRPNNALAPIASTNSTIKSAYIRGMSNVAYAWMIK